MMALNTIYRMNWVTCISCQSRSRSPSTRYKGTGYGPSLCLLCLALTSFVLRDHDRWHAGRVWSLWEFVPDKEKTKRRGDAKLGWGRFSGKRRLLCVCVRHANYFSGPVILASYSHGMAGSKSGRDELDNRVMHLGLGYVFVSRHPTSTWQQHPLPHSFFSLSSIVSRPIAHFRLVTSNSKRISRPEISALYSSVPKKR